MKNPSNNDEHEWFIIIIQPSQIYLTRLIRNMTLFKVQWDSNYFTISMRLLIYSVVTTNTWNRIELNQNKTTHYPRNQPLEESDTVTYLTIFLMVLNGFERSPRGETYFAPKSNFAPAPTYWKDFSAATFPIFAPFPVERYDIFHGWVRVTDMNK